MHGAGLEVAKKKVWCGATWREGPRAAAPAPALDERDWQDNLRGSRDEHAEVDHAVLLGPDQLVAFQDQNRHGAIVYDAQLRHATALVQLLYPQCPAFESRVEKRDSLLGGCRPAHEWEEVQRTVGDGPP